MRLRKPCQHERYDAHKYLKNDRYRSSADCPGGEFLSGDALALALMEIDGVDLSGLIGSWAEEQMDEYRAKAQAVLIRTALTVLETEHGPADTPN